MGIATITLTKKQLRELIDKEVAKKLEKHRKENHEDLENEFVNTAMLLLLSLPLCVLHDYYPSTIPGKNIPEFTERVLEYYKLWQDGELRLEDLEEELWKHGGVRLEKEQKR